MCHPIIFVDWYIWFNIYLGISCGMNDALIYIDICSFRHLVISLGMKNRMITSIVRPKKCVRNELVYIPAQRDTDTSG